MPLLLLLVLFPYLQGWVGADAAYSIPLNHTTTVWLFGDTFIGNHRDPKTMIHNSIAIRKCEAGPCSVTYWWSGMHTGRGSSFFKTPESDYFWPLDGFVFHHCLYIFLEQMHATGNGGAFGFDYSKIVLAVVPNFTETPDKWRISYRTIATGNQVVPGVAAVLDSEYLYAFTLFRRSAPKPFVGLLRLPLSDLPEADAAAGWQYLAGLADWKPWQRSTSPQDASKLLDGNITEMSVAYHAQQRKWLAIYPTPGFLSNSASFSQAPNLAGPWAPSKTFFSYPEMKTTDPRYTPHVFCYADKEHPELETGTDFAFTYACNSTEEPEILHDLRLYRPELVLRPGPFPLQ